MPGFEPGPPPAECEIALHAWRIMGGYNLANLPIVFELLPVEDAEILIEQLIIIRDDK